jgi:DNA-binding transcriptional ArsR family regulator
MLRLRPKHLAAGESIIRQNHAKGRTMLSDAEFAEMAALAGDPARASMLGALMDGRALTASELASVAGVSPQTASGHLGRLVQAELLAVEKQGRHRYHRLASPAIARMIESIMQAVAGRSDPAGPTLVTGPKDAAMRAAARTCYDHLAGRLGVALSDALIGAGHVELATDGGIVTETGLALLDRLGIDLVRSVGSSRRVLCRPCLDWSERRPHLAGVVGAALCAHALSAGLIRRIEGTRAVAITPKGLQAFRGDFRVTST